MTKYMLAIVCCIFVSNQAMAKRPLTNEGWDWQVVATYKAEPDDQTSGTGTGHTKDEALKNAAMNCKVGKVPPRDQYCNNSPVHTKFKRISCRNADSKENNDDHFHPGTTWEVCSGYVLKFETNGNLVYKNKNGEVIWESATAGSGANKLSIQGDGNMVLYIKAAGSKPQKAVWATHTQSGPAVYLSVRQDGDLVLYTKPDNILWSANTKGK